MISVLPARSAEDFEAMAGLCRKLAQWDADAVAPYGVSEADVKAIFHPERSGSSVAAKFGVPDAMAFIARSAGLPAGCLAFDQFDDNNTEIHKFFVDAPFRGKGNRPCADGGRAGGDREGPEPDGADPHDVLHEKCHCRL
ncbi:GNAT family N-acetyltransferase [Mesorhizobium sp. STM 4661]|uniref:GNAT family N-acetyltransferase n=1 Tax=Mesorhizobium sp. STM 4661 TaxID=1297570 RepID=UPI0002BE3BA0|nr:GNAT family N-acetyltransferase [Mesorhizobium sp. STM 4661]CCV10276.1 hypothetical protein MESS4_150040 [Mesorhizobium sp. STM 4661]